MLVGLGMGPASLSFILSVQHSVKWGQRGVATGAVIFLRTIGGALGVGLLGAAPRLGAGASPGRGGRLAGSTSPPRCGPRPINCLSAGQLAIVQAHLGHALRDVYLQMAALGIGTMLAHALAAQQARDPRVGRRVGREEDADEGFAVAASEM